MALPIRLMSKVNVTLSGSQTVDGVATAAGNLVLCLYQTAALENGVYVAQGGAWVRFVDSFNEIDTPGKEVMATDGDTNRYRKAVLLKPTDSVNQANAELWREVGSKTAVAPAPGANDDVLSGYHPGFLWVNETADTVEVCEDAAAGAAVWNIIDGA